METNLRLGLVNEEKCDSRAKINATAGGSKRVMSHLIFTPGVSGALERLERAVKAGIKHVCVHKGLFPPQTEKQFTNLLGYCNVSDLAKIRALHGVTHAYGGLGYRCHLYGFASLAAGTSRSNLAYGYVRNES